MSKKAVWSHRAKTDIIEIKNFFDRRNKSKRYSRKLLNAFRDSANFIQKYPDASAKTDFENVRGFIILKPPKVLFFAL